MPRNARQVKHVIRLLKGAVERQRPIEWVLLENVEALLDRLGAVELVVSDRGLRFGLIAEILEG